MPDELPENWETQVARAYTTFGVDPLEADEFGLFGRIGEALDVDFLRRKAKQQLRDAVGRWVEERGELPTEHEEPRGHTNVEIPNADIDAWDTRKVRKKLRKQFTVPNANLKGKHRLKVPDGWEGQLSPGDSIEVEYDDDGFLRDIQLPGSVRFVSRKELDDLEIGNGIRDEETVPDEEEEDHGVNEWLDAWTPPGEPRRRDKDR